MLLLNSLEVATVLFCPISFFILYDIGQNDSGVTLLMLSSDWFFMSKTLTISDCVGI